MRSNQWIDRTCSQSSEDLMSVEHCSWMEGFIARGILRVLQLNEPLRQFSCDGRHIFQRENWEKTNRLSPCPLMPLIWCCTLCLSPLLIFQSPSPHCTAFLERSVEAADLIDELILISADITSVIKFLLLALMGKVQGSWQGQDTRILIWTELGSKQSTFWVSTSYSPTRGTRVHDWFQCCLQTCNSQGYTTA